LVLADQTRQAARRLAILLGQEATALVTGRVSIEVDPRLSFNREGTEVAALDMIAQFRALGVESSRLLVKIAATWEGIQAVRRLQTKGIDCNVALVFSEIQALAAADAGAFLISPSVGSVGDWHKARHKLGDARTDDPGVGLVLDVYRTLKAQRRKTSVMATSFHSVAQIEAVAGCDLLAIAPQLLQQLAAAKGPLRCVLYPGDIAHSLPEAPISESGFRYILNQSAIATEMLCEGIRGMVANVDDLETRLTKLIMDRKRGHGRFDLAHNRVGIVA
jgi:transaldolase